MAPQIFAFLGVSTTNVLASNSPHAPGIPEEERMRRTAHGQRMLCYLLTIAIGFGVVVVVVLQAGPSSWMSRCNCVSCMQACAAHQGALAGCSCSVVVGFRPGG